MNLNDPVDQDAPHPLGDLWLVLHVLMLRLIVHLGRQEMLEDIRSELRHILGIISILIVAILHCLREMLLASPLELSIHLAKLLLKPLSLLPLIFFFPLLHLVLGLVLKLGVLHARGGAAGGLGLGPDVHGQVGAIPPLEARGDRGSTTGALGDRRYLSLPITLGEMEVAHVSLD